MRNLLLSILLLNSVCTFAQNDSKHPIHQQDEDDEKDEDKDNKNDDSDGDHMGFHATRQTMIRMSSAYSLYLPMTRNGSGTSWQPDASYIYGKMIHAHNWVFMASGDIFLRYNKQDISGVGMRGGEKFDAPDMLMFMGQRKVGKYGLFHFNSMFSTDALIAGGEGYPLLFQTGESWKGLPLVDRQHPHDLFSEISVSYAQAVANKTDVYVYLGYPGEPALGPVTFMHRASGMFNPDAPLGHHWSDATHITFGVATLGVRYGKFKIEGSSFTGREPDEERLGFDMPLFDSRSARLSFNPSYNWSIQVSQGFIKSPEALHPDEDIVRSTASATYVKSLGKWRYVTATALWGQNEVKNEHQHSTSLLAEGTIKLNRKIAYARYEWVQKNGLELALDPWYYGTDKNYNINALTLGVSYELFNAGFITTAIGGQVTAYKSAAQLESVYGNTPVAAEVYLHLYPRMMNTR